MYPYTFMTSTNNPVNLLPLFPILSPLPYSKYFFVYPTDSYHHLFYRIIFDTFEISEFFVDAITFIYTYSMFEFAN